MYSVLVTGTSSGIGFATALEFARAGHRVFATLRDPSRGALLEQQAQDEKLPVSIHTMDVDSDESVNDCFAALERQGSIPDVLINNAGVERHGTIEELPWEAIRATMETNYFGALRCIRAIVPRLRERGAGCIVNVTSVAGKVVSSPLGAYAASKFALEAASEALAQELKPFGVRVVVIEPGIIDTPMARAIGVPPSSKYRQPAQFAAMFRDSLRTPVPPSLVASAIRRIVESGDWRLRHPVGPDALPLLAARAALTDEQWIDASASGETIRRPIPPGA